MGNTIILGGLRRKAVMDNEEKVPFLGDIPGLGKLFGSMRLTSNNTEMFIFITPTIVTDPEEQLLKIRNLKRSKNAQETSLSIYNGLSRRRIKSRGGTLEIALKPCLVIAMSNAQASNFKEFLKDLVQGIRGKSQIGPAAQAKHLPPKPLESSEEIAAKLGLAYLTDLSEFAFVKEKVTLLPYPFAKGRMVLPLEEQEGGASDRDDSPLRS